MSNPKEQGSDASSAVHVEKENPHSVSKHLDGDDAVLRPESIRNMSDADLKLLEKKMVRKMDFVIMSVSNYSLILPRLYRF
jgi:hypothetical protein